ncbi:hypothetical protein R1sor_021399 [Riccia sorocarpa]|uniref:Reverse transcriptase domain-containing protein n=1 Tax=Riccia sorocarpa TaxID=122646 RepID=A0ABD3GHQ4_9MARC
MEVIEDSYRNLYAAEEDMVEAQRKQEHALELIDKRFTEEHNRKLDKMPSEELIEEVVRSMPKDKLLGFDGVIVEVLRAGWEYMKQDCFNMVRQVWRLGRLLQKDNRGVIKLIPKAKELFWLKNWRPITLLTLTYKIIAKIMVWRQRDMLAGVIDQQQSGFIAGIHSGGLEELEKLCRSFLWGWSKAWNSKASVIAWERIATSKDCGGLGWTHFRVKAQTMHNKNILKIVLRADAEWVSLAKNLILKTLRKGKYQRERRQWKLADAIILLRVHTIKGSNTLSRLFQTWKGMLKKIIWDREHRELPAHLTLVQGVLLMNWDDPGQEAACQLRLYVKLELPRYLKEEQQQST